MNRTCVPGTIRSGVSMAKLARRNPGAEFDLPVDPIDDLDDDEVDDDEEVRARPPAPSPRHTATPAP